MPNICLRCYFVQKLLFEDIRTHTRTGTIALPRPLKLVGNYNATMRRLVLLGLVSKPSRQVSQAGEAVGQVAGAVGGGVQRHDALHVPAPPRRARLPVPGLQLDGRPLRPASVHELGGCGRCRRLHAVLGRDARLDAGHVRRRRGQHGRYGRDNGARPTVDTATSDGCRLRTEPGQ